MQYFQTIQDWIIASIAIILICLNDILFWFQNFLHIFCY